MTRRPWFIILLSLLHIVAPIGNYFISAWSSGMSLTDYAFTFNSPFDFITFFLLLPLAGIAIYICKPWSYAVFVSVMAWSFYTNTVSWNENPEQAPLGLLLIIYLLNIIVVTYFFVPSVRTVYFNRKVRWWESDPRYFKKINAVLLTPENQSIPVEIDNISIHGALISSDHLIELWKNFQFQFEDLGLPVVVQVQVVNQRAQTKLSGLYFDQFVNDTKKNLKKIIKGYEKAGVKRRPERMNPVKNFFVSLKGLVTKGEGLFPDIPTEFKNKNQ